MLNLKNNKIIANVGKSKNVGTYGDKTQDGKSPIPVITQTALCQFNSTFGARPLKS
jgi:hypothetical protein